MAIAIKIGLCSLLLLLAACDQETGTPAKGAADAVSVGYVALRPQPAARQVELSGRVVALATADVRPQVDGIVRSVVFQEGRQVQEGDVLYQLNDAKFKAARDAAAAALKKAEASQAGAQSTFDRDEKLVVTKAVSVQDLEDARSALLQAQASTEAARADLEAAQINLDNATIRAPITGIIGLSSVSVGALVTENQTTALATIRQVDPIHVDLADTSANLLRIRDEVQAGRLGREKQGEPASVTLALETGKPYAQKGELSLADTVVSQTTGTFSLRTRFPNPDRVLIPGMFVRASVDLGTIPAAFLVPQRALTRGDDGKATVFVVSADESAEQKTVTTIGSTNNNWIVTDGVKDGDRLIVDGFQKISNGSKVKPIEVTIDADGVVRQTIEAEARSGKGTAQ